MPDMHWCETCALEGAYDETSYEEQCQRERDKVFSSRYRAADNEHGFEKRCDCGEWVSPSEFYAHRPRCKQCFMADIVMRKRGLRDPFAALTAAWSR